MKFLLSLIALLLCCVVNAQIVYDTVPLNRQLVGRDIISNTGDIIVNGNVDNTSTPYDSLKVKLYRNNIPQDSISKLLIYSGNYAPFNFKIPITAELENYKIEIYGKSGAVETLEKEVDSLVAGDVFMINGQSNAEAARISFSGTNTTANGNQSDFIRVYAMGTNTPNHPALQLYEKWYIGEGDGDYDTAGNTGQWGLKLARTLMDSLQVPIAIFNGAEAGSRIDHFDPSGGQNSYGNNYIRLYNRLNETGLKEKVRAIFWSQGEADGIGGSSISTLQYKNDFTALKNSWFIDFPNIEHIYIFQTRNGYCQGELYMIKEAQRQIAEENTNISVMSTQGIESDGCHFKYIDGYETFANRISPLVLTDLYNESFPQEIETPMITDASMVNDTTLVVETDATALFIVGNTEDFRLEDAGNTTLNIIDSITVSSNKILFHLSANPGTGATISYMGQDGDPYPVDSSSGFITNTSGIEIVSFYRYPIVPPPNSTSSLLITQYYEGTGSNDQWVEVKNISSNPINGGDFYLALFKQTKAVDGTIQISPPDQSVQIVNSGGLGSPIAPGEVILFQRPSAASPSSPNLGLAHTIISPVCDFDGNDVILISSTNDNTSFNNKVDIIGEVAPTGQSPSNWGQDKSFVKGYNNSMEPSDVFDISDFVELKLSEVDVALSDMNIALGTHNEGITTWTNTSIWDNGTTDRTRSALVTGGYDQTHGFLSAGKLLVQSNVNFNNTSTDYIEVSDSLIIDAVNGGLLTLGDKASLYTVNASNPDSLVTIIGTINKVETTTQLTNSDDYTYWSSPVENDNTIIVFPVLNYNQDRIYYWDQEAPNLNPGGGGEDLGEWIDASNTTMISGKGYISQGPTTGVSYPATADIIFSGKPNTGKIQLIGGNDVVFNDEAPNPDNPNNDLNLIGNPYPSAIKAISFIDYPDNVSSITGTLWFWTHNTPNNGSTTGEQYAFADYALYNKTGSTTVGGVTPDEFIASGQGFMVQTQSNTNKTITFVDSMRVKQNNTQFFRQTDTKNTMVIDKDRVWLNMESSAGGAFSQILIGFDSNATDGVDYGYDGIKISQGWINLYSKIDTLNYGIQGLSEFSVDKKVPLAFNSYIDDNSVTYNISIDRFEGALNDNDIYLFDHELNVTHDLKQGAYTFSLTSWGSYDDRFTLQFAKATLGVDDLGLHNDFIVINDDNTLLAKSNTMIRELKMYDITGRLLVTMLPNESEFKINMHNIRKGTVLILNATFENGTEISKKAIKY